MNYSNPCDKCTKKTYQRFNCESWVKYFLAAWERFRKYPVRLYRARKKAGAVATERFRYIHPDLVRRYLREGPCGGCPRKDDCGTVCTAYWGWWDVRMEWLRRKWSMIDVYDI